MITYKRNRPPDISMLRCFRTTAQGEGKSIVHLEILDATRSHLIFAPASPIDTPEILLCSIKSTQVTRDFGKHFAARCDGKPNPQPASRIPGGEPAG